MARAPTIDRIERLEKLKARLKSDDAMTVREIADEFGVSARTLSRDLAILKDQGLPVEADRGRGGGIRLHRNWGTGRINLDYAEAVDLLMSLAIAEQMKSSLFMANLKSARHKLMASFSSSMRFKVRGLKARILVGQASSTAVLSTHSDPDPQIIRELHQAFLMQLSVDISYLAENGARSNRIIQPHYFLLCYPVWYILAWDELREGVRTFRCDRIKISQNIDREFQLLSIAHFEKALEGISTV